MNVLRSIGQDLVEKKLWPVAVALVVLLAAVPVLLGGGGDDVVVPAESAAVAGAPAVDLPGAGQVAVAAERPPAAPRAKSRRDPFRQQFVKKTESEAPAAAGGAKPAAAKEAAPASTPKTGGGAGAKSPASSSPSPAPEAAPKAPAPKLDPLDIYRVSLRFGRPGEQKTMRDVSRLSPLPNADQPFFVFLGVLSGGKKAVFLVSSEATPTGEGRCLPSKDDCQTLELAPGDTTYLERESGSKTIRYRLDLASIRRRASSTTSGDLTPTRAKKDSGDDASSALAAGTGYRWDSGKGVLVRRESSAKTRAGEDAASAAQAAAEDEARKAATIALVTWYFAVVASIQHAAANGLLPAAEAPAAPAPAAVAPEAVPAPAP